jgi:trehalose 6-phosphate synthase
MRYQDRRDDEPGPAAGDPPLVVVANRLPLRRIVERHTERWEPSPGGLVSSLAPVMKGRRCAWVGWSGDDGAIAPFSHEGIQFIPVPIEHHEIEGYYDGFSNRTLWPLYHDAIRPPEYRSEWWETYQQINHRFADAVAGNAQPGAQVWIHDYQLQLVPSLLRTLRPDLQIGFFLHISFPPQELFLQLPWRAEIIEGMLGADLIGFQVPEAARNFSVLANRITRAEGRSGHLSHEGRTIRVSSFPVSINVERFADIAQRQETRLRAKEIREQLGNPRTIFLGVDRLDYTKGIGARLEVYKEMLLDGTINVPESVLVQIAVPTRDNVPAYVEQRLAVERLVGEINGLYAQMGAPAVHYLHQNLPIEELVALYCVADILLVTPYRDGMNLVAKEYVASRSDSGAVVLSEFAGAAQSMSAAYLVNPHHTQQVKEAMLAAVVDSPAEHRRRMRSMRQSLYSWSDADWSKAFLDALAALSSVVPSAVST